jgi:hypothetical protein
MFSAGIRDAPYGSAGAGDSMLASRSLRNRTSYLPVFLRLNEKIMPGAARPRDISWAKIAPRTWKKGDADDIFGRSAQLAYNFSWRFFPC